MPLALRSLALLALAACTPSYAARPPAPDESGARPTIDLTGSWRFAFDSARLGAGDAVRLPGTLDQNAKGRPNRDTTEARLNRLITHVGPAWFQRDVDIPASWAGRRVELVLERTKVATVYVDGNRVGSQRGLFAPQVYDVTAHARPGRRTVTIVVNNDTALVPVAGSHAYSEDTQTNWNGILGALRLEASTPTRIRDVRVTPDVGARAARVRVRLDRPPGSVARPRVRVAARAFNAGPAHEVPARVHDLSATDTVVELSYEIGPGMQTWSAWRPALYRLDVTLLDGGRPLDRRTVEVGMRELRAVGTRLAINGLGTFLRGKHDAAVFPHTGHPPMSDSAWERVLRIAKSHGINHYRFHSWTPPAAAFRAADRVGIYLQPELPMGSGFRAADTAHAAFMLREGRAVLDAYGNHASFVMLALGDELAADPDTLRRMVAALRAHDPRPLYARSDESSDVRLASSLREMRQGGLLNAMYPNTTWDHGRAIAGSPVPVIAHEVGQYQVYPSYAELPKYRGVLRPWNLERFRRRLAERGMLDLAERFQQASGALALLGYRAEIEAALRTPGFGGFQLLDLQDYPGRGSRLVGMLDAYMESKGLVTPERFRSFNDDVTLLVRMPRYVWLADETFRGEVQVANYGPTSLGQPVVRWRVEAADGVVAQGELRAAAVPQGTLASVGAVELSLGGGARARRLTLRLRMDGGPSGAVETEYPLWVYPAAAAARVPDVPPGVVESRALDEATLAVLRRGGRVVLFPDSASIARQSVGGRFTPDPHGTLGLLVDSAHAALADFPTSFHTDWQWWSIVKKSRPLVLDATPAAHRPIVQVIDDVERQHKLGLLFEYRVGPGRLLVCTSDLPSLGDPAARQLHASLLRYAGSEAFRPGDAIREDELLALLYGRP